MQLFDDIFFFVELEVESLRTGDDGIGDFVDLGRRQNELDVFRWLFQSLQEGVESPLGEHVDLVYDIHFVRRLRRLELSTLDHVTDIIDSGIGRSIDFYDIKQTSFVESTTVLARSTWITIQSERETIDSLRQNARHRRFSRSA